MINVLQSIHDVADSLQYIKINGEKVNEFANSISPADLKISEISLAYYDWTLEQLIELVFTFNVINYCFWAEKSMPKWTIKLRGNELDGSIALFRALEEQVKMRGDFTSGESLAHLSNGDLKKALKGNIQIPMFDERLNALNSVGEVLLLKYKGSWLNVLEESRNNALELVRLLVDNFPAFDDYSMYLGKKVGFYKRAQLNSKMISDVLLSKDRAELIDLNKLTAFADYKVPQILRTLGVFEYSDELIDDIDNYRLIEQGSTTEVEIRIATIHSIEMIRKALVKKYPEVTSSHIDNILWNKSQSLKRDKTPYHRTYTTAY